MSILAVLHRDAIFPRRVRSICAQLAKLFPENATVLDVGAGDGSLALRLRHCRPDLQISGIDILVRPEAKIPVQRFDGSRIPYPDCSFDVVMFVDVLHHTKSPMSLLAEATRVSNRWLIIKDHLREGFLAGTRLRLIDWVGNARYGVSLPYNYLGPRQWAKAFQLAELDLTYRLRTLNMYPWPATWLFDCKLQFIAKLSKQRPRENRSGEGELPAAPAEFHSPLPHSSTAVPSGLRVNPGGFKEGLPHTT